MPLDAEFWNRSDPADARNALVEMLRYELLGPSDPGEEIDESPLTRYLLGMLAPFGTTVADDEDDVLDSSSGTESEDGIADADSDQVGEATCLNPAHAHPRLLNRIGAGEKLCSVNAIAAGLGPNKRADRLRR